MAKTFKTVSEFKSVLAIGDKLHTIYHLDHIGRDEKGNVIYGDKDMGVREVSIKQTNSFALKTFKPNGSYSDSWCDFPRASMSVVKDNTITLMQYDTRGFSGAMSPKNPEFVKLPLIPVLSYRFAEKKTFILGYKSTGEEVSVDGRNLTLYNTKEEADYDSEEWVAIEAYTEAEARGQYEQARVEWIQNQNCEGGPKVSN
jgi:hypothetical protein